MRRADCCVSDLPQHCPYPPRTWSVLYVYILQGGKGLEAVCYLYSISHGDAAVLTDAFNIETFMFAQPSRLEWNLKSHMGKEQHIKVSHGQGAAYDHCWQGLLHHDTHGRTLSSADLADEL